MTTSSAGISSSAPLRFTRAVTGARSSRLFIEERVFSMVRASSHSPSMNKNETAAASQYSPIKIAPMIAIVTSKSIATIL